MYACACRTDACGVVRQEAKRLRGPSQRVPYIHNYLPGPEATAEEALAWPNLLSSRSENRGFASSLVQQQQRPYRSPYGGTTMNPSFNAEVVQAIIAPTAPSASQMKGTKGRRKVSEATNEESSDVADKNRI